MRRWTVVHSVMLADFLADFDRLRCGEIPVGQFRSGLSLSGYRLTEAEFELLADAYASDTRAGCVRWRQFADDVLAAVAPKELARTPTVTPAHPREAVADADVPAAPARQPAVARTNEIVARFVKTRRIALVEQFKDKDRMNHRRVTATAFAQVLQLIGVHISKAEIDVLCVFYNDPRTDFVDYPRFVADIDSIVGQIFGDRASASIVVNPIPKYGNDESPFLVSQLSTAGHVSDWPEVRDRLQTFVFRRRVRLSDFFIAFDAHHCGRVAQQKLRSVVRQAALPLTAQQIDVCIDEFAVDGDLFDWRGFCTQIDEAFGVKELNRAPQNPGVAVAAALPDPSTTLQRLNWADEEDIRRILTRMRALVLTRRMNIREQFKDYDLKPHKNYITKRQFNQSIARLGLAVAQAELDVLCRKYRCTDLDDMNYQAFCSDIDPQDT